MSNSPPSLTPDDTPATVSASTLQTPLQMSVPAFADVDTTPVVDEGEEVESYERAVGSSAQEGPLPSAVAWGEDTAGLSSTLTARHLSYTCPLGHSHIGVFKWYWSVLPGQRLAMPLDPTLDSKRVRRVASMTCRQEFPTVMRYTKYTHQNDYQRILERNLGPPPMYTNPPYMSKEDFERHKSSLSTEERVAGELYFNEEDQYQEILFLEHACQRITRRVEQLNEELLQCNLNDKARFQKERDIHFLVDELDMRRKMLFPRKARVSPLLGVSWQKYEAATGLLDLQELERNLEQLSDTGSAEEDRYKRYLLLRTRQRMQAYANGQLAIMGIAFRAERELDTWSY